MAGKFDAYEHPGYKKPAKDFAAHYSANHFQNEHIMRKPVGIIYGADHCESFYRLLKPSVYGSWHSTAAIPKACQGIYPKKPKRMK